MTGIVKARPAVDAAPQQVTARLVARVGHDRGSRAAPLRHLRRSAFHRGAEADQSLEEWLGGTPTSGWPGTDLHGDTLALASHDHDERRGEEATLMCR